MDFKVTEHGGINPETESPKLVAQHKSAYAFMLPHVSQKDVLEIGHGDGYGSYWLSQTARSVTAVDLFERNVLIASEKYKAAGLRYRVMNATELLLENESIDIVCSFQVIEHIPRGLLDRYVAEIKRVLRPGGKAFISTLNLKKNQKPGKPYDKSPDHDREFTPSEYAEFFGSYFERPQIFGLYPKWDLAVMEKLKKTGIFRCLPHPLDPVRKFYSQIHYGHMQWKQKSNLDDCIDLMAVVTK